MGKVVSMNELRETFGKIDTSNINGDLSTIDLHMLSGMTGLSEDEVKEIVERNGNMQDKREECLSKAKECVCSDREEQYGSPEDSFKLIAKLWSAYMDKSISPTDVAMMMSLLKIARIKENRFHEDSFIDLAGYAACGYELKDTE